MSAPHIILDNCQIWWKFDVVITKIILLVFLDTVYVDSRAATLLLCNMHA